MEELQPLSNVFVFSSANNAYESLLYQERQSILTTHTRTQETLVGISSADFAKGYRLGRIWYFHGEAELPIDDTYLLVNIQSYCEKGLHSDPEWLAERVGFLMGMVSGKLIPEEL